MYQHHKECAHHAQGRESRAGGEGGATKVGVRNKGNRSSEQGVTSNEELEEQKRRDFMESGVPLEGEFMLIKGVGNSCREAVAEEIFKGTSRGL